MSYRSPFPALSIWCPRPTIEMKAKDFKTDQEVRWCPGCGDYAILAAVQGFMPELGLKKENIVFVSGIGCSSRFPYYMNTYGLHSIHGRAPGHRHRPGHHSAGPIGLGGHRRRRCTVIGGNHLIHALRRNVNLKILLFNNRIYGLTKGQYSPTSEQGKVTKSTPLGSLDYAFNPVSVALGAEATFVARTIDSDRKHMTEVLRAAAAHEGSALVEIYQNCNIFNDDAWEPLKENDVREDNLIRLQDGEPIIFGNNADKCVVRDSDGHLQVMNVADVDQADIIIFDAHAKDPGLAFGLSRLYNPRTLTNTPIGVFRDVTHREAYDRMAQQQVADVIDAQGPGDLQALLRGSDTWTVN